MQIPTPKTCLAQSIHTHSTHTHTCPYAYTHMLIVANVSFIVQRPYICFPNGLRLHYSIGHRVCNFVLYNM